MLAKAGAFHISEPHQRALHAKLHLITGADVVEPCECSLASWISRNAFGPELRTNVRTRSPPIPTSGTGFSGNRRTEFRSGGREGYEITIASDENVVATRDGHESMPVETGRWPYLLGYLEGPRHNRWHPQHSRGDGESARRARSDFVRSISDDERGDTLALEHLVSLGHRDICHIGGPRTSRRSCPVTWILEAMKITISRFRYACRNTAIYSPRGRVGCASTVLRKTAPDCHCMGERRAGGTVSHLGAMTPFDPSGYAPGRHSIPVKRHALRGFGFAATDDG